MGLCSGLDFQDSISLGSREAAFASASEFALIFEEERGLLLGGAMRVRSAGGGIRVKSVAGTSVRADLGEDLGVAFGSGDLLRGGDLISDTGAGGGGALTLIAAAGTLVRAESLSVPLVAAAGT